MHLVVLSSKNSNENKRFLDEENIVVDYLNGFYRQKYIKIEGSGFKCVTSLSLIDL
jgi:hypothetical protein